MIIRLVVLVQLIVVLSACSTWTHASILSYTNVQKSSDGLISSKAGFEVKPNRGDPDMLMILALSGGGSRSVPFPGAFNSMTLLDYSEDQGDSRYAHVFDGGNVDNLGLMSVLRIIDTLHVKNINDDKFAIILVEAFIESVGISQAQADPRGALDFFFDSNTIDVIDSLLARNRKNQLETFKQEFKANFGASQSVFYHLKFSDIEDIVQRKKL